MAAWIKALRLRTLPLALGSIFLGTYQASVSHTFNGLLFSLILTTAVLLQIISNLANDYGDFLKGSDAHRTDRMVSAGSISPDKMRNVIIVLSVVTFLLGLFLLYKAFNDFTSKEFLYFLLTGILCIVAALAYTLGKRPYGYIGLGDFFVFIFFGLVGVCGTYYLFAKEFSRVILFPASAYGFLSAGVLNINNTRDIETDRKSGKYTLPALIGRNNAKLYQVILLCASFFCMLSYLLIQKSLLHLVSLAGYIFLFVVLFNFLRVKGKSESYTALLKQFAIGSFLTILVYIGINLMLQ